MDTGQSKVYLVTGNETLRNRDLFLENLLFHKAKKNENPLLVDLLANHSCFTGAAAKKDGKDKGPAFFEFFTESRIPRVTGDRLVAELNGKSRDELMILENGFSETFILGAFPQENDRFYNCIDHILFVLKNEYESSSYLFNFVNGLYDKMIAKNMGIIVSGIKKVEDAARLFIKIREEMKELIDPSLTFDFIGSLDLELNKITFARKRKVVYLKIFENDPLHGNIKYINEKLAGLEYFKTESFFEAIAKSGKADS